MDLAFKFQINEKCCSYVLSVSVILMGQTKCLLNIVDHLKNESSTIHDVHVLLCSSIFSTMWTEFRTLCSGGGFPSDVISLS